ncbi:MAG: pyruvate formate-lyase 1-activating enzyme, partial [Clostridia bacterium]|nr:pyruvate formate-lyase 1-activating enzyme [Clostridia bacterium]
TVQNIKFFKQFLEACKQQNKKMWIRQVIVPGLNDDLAHVQKLKDFVATLQNVEKVELLPYKTIGVHKYRDLKIRYRLEGTPDMDEEKCKQLENILIKKD